MQSNPKGDESDATGVVTVLLGLIRDGDQDAENRLYALLQSELRALARRQLKSEADRHTLQPTALVNEAWMRLAKAGGVRATDRSHFMSVASRAMRTALVDHARRKQALKRPSNGERLPLEEALERTFELCSERGFDPLDLDDALSRLERDHPRQAQLVELRFFGGLTRGEAAEALGVSRTTAARDWELARLWLIWELGLADD